MGRYSDLRPALDGARFDVAVIGGGINGVAIARECVRGGRHTLLVEQSDFASGTTSRATRIIHGGLRYLEHGEVDLVRESLRERAHLAAENPHLVRPLEFLLPIGPGSRRSPLEIRAGLWMYRRMGGRFAEERLGTSNLDGLLASAQRWSVFRYEDAKCEFPERLVADWLAEACTQGLEARNYTQALDVRIVGGSVRGLRIRDLLSGVESEVEVPWILNASGPWVDRVCHAAGLTRTRTLVGGVRGTHVVLPRFSGAPEAAVYGEASDGRPIFLVPWNGQILLGTTEVPDGNDPSRVQPSEREIEYLFAWLHRFFPGARVGRDDMAYAYAGVRPLPFAPGSAPAQITRRHILHDHAPEGARGMISIVGGKLTTAASLAREVARATGLRVSEPRGIAYVPAVAEGMVDRWMVEIAQQSEQPLDRVKALVDWHGPAAMRIAQLAASDERLRAPLCDGTPHMVAEAVHALRHEHAVHLADVLLRRVPVALSGWWTREATREAAQRIGAALEWSEAETYAETELFEIERGQMLFNDYLPAPLRRPA